MDETILADLMRDPAVVAFSPILDRKLRLGNGRLVRVLGIDPFLDRAIHPQLVPDAREKRAREDPAGRLELLTTPEAVLVEAGLAGELGVSAGSVLRTPNGGLRVVGTFPNPSGEPLLIADIAFAQRLFGASGKVDRVELVLSDEAGLKRRFPQGFRIQSHVERQKTYDAMVGAFRLNLEAMSLVALFVSVFLIYNTAMFTVVSRRKDAGILFSLGATRREVVGAFLAEISLLGVAGGAIGSVLGYFLSFFLTAIIGGTISNLYFSLRPSTLPWSAWVLLTGMALGLAASVLGSIVPLRELARTDPVETLRGRSPSRRGVGTAKKAAAAGLGIILLSAILYLIAPPHIYTAFVVIFLYLVGLSLLTGLILVWVAPVLKRVLHLIGGLPGTMAAANIHRNLGRSGVAVAAFMIALSMSIGLASMIGSFRQSLVWWMESQLRGDLYVSNPSDVGVPAAFYEEVRAIPGIGGVDAYRKVQISFRGRTAFITAIDASVLARYDRFGWVAGDDSHWERVKRGDVIVSESFARNFGVRAGQVIAVEAKDGPADLRVEAVFYDYTTEHGVIMMDRTTYLRLFDDHAIDSVAVFNDPGSPRRQEIIDLVREKATAQGLPAFTRDEFYRNILTVFDSTFAVTRSMRIMAIIIAFFGIAGALITLFIERRRDFGILRALGFSTGQVSAMTLLEAIGMGMVSFVLSIGVGTMLALFLIKVINLRSFNWTIFFYPEWAPYAVTALTALLASVGAALYPIVKVIRTYPQIQIREE